jgi:hypothetical protein
LQKRYAGLHNQPPVPPVMIHHISQKLTRTIADDDSARVALVLVDGLSLQQWLTVGDVLRAGCLGLRFSEDAAFAWIPTITSVCRQAIFAGQTPLYFRETIERTDKDETRWRKLWTDRGLNDAEVEFNSSADCMRTDRLDDLLRPGIRALGIIIRKVDDVMHGEQLGMSGMQAHVRQWVEAGAFGAMLRTLADNGFTSIITSDHGNVEATGCGRPTGGSLAKSRGQRVRIHDRPALVKQGIAECPGALEWPRIGLPDDYLPVLASNRHAFVPAGSTVVTHGGATIDEVLVPVIEVERDAK